jgi:hypothetical protein
MARLCFSTYAADMKECDAPESNYITTEVALMKNIPRTTSGASWASSTATWLTLPRALFCLAATGTGLAPHVGGSCRCTRLIRTRARIGASVSKMTFLSIGIALSFSLRWALSSLGPLNILISSSRGLETIEVMNHLTLQGRESLSSRLRSLLKLRLSRAEYRSS